MIEGVNKNYYATGRRKTASARAFLTEGKGNILINNKNMEQYFRRKIDQEQVYLPLELVDKLNEFDFYITVKGGGTSGQAGAVRHAIARALVSYDELTFRKQLRTAGYLTRDSRKVERKKVAHVKSRKREAYTKR